MNKKILSIRLIYLILILANACLLLIELFKFDTPENISIAFSASAFINIIFSIIILLFIFATFVTFLQKWKGTSVKKRRQKFLSFKISKDLIFISINSLPFLIISFKIAVEELIKINLFTYTLFWVILIFCVIIWLFVFILTISIYVIYKKVIKKIMPLEVENDIFWFFEEDNFNLEISDFYNFDLNTDNEEIKVTITKYKNIYLNDSFVKLQFIINESKRSSNPQRF
ncbi:hypothetical protein [Spiroplasma endosymbiont of Labia minor]|uniref:hypothetical protein n=1 Tax=Spiroplasma endosymbiont of Labia minor TaxID=3066305 RepID=UPI0030D0536E